MENFRLTQEVTKRVICIIYYTVCGSEIINPAEDHSNAAIIAFST